MGTEPYDTENSDGDARRFAAFISYSHTDAYAAAKLQRKLERYRLPGRIAKTRNRPAALGAIFRDREDLAAAANLSDAIRDAIRRTDVLIVICSPDAAASPWVAAEIGLFRSLHPDRPILAVLLSGAPATSFPAALTEGGLEPLAADLRPDGDGAQLGFLKIVAGIAGVPLDALIQRDAQRRIRRVMAITVGALAAVLIMVVMTTLALSAGNEAARQRAEAEGLVEYMLTDLREKLKGVGRLAIMEDVNRRAMQHYAKQGNLTNLPADSLQRRARIVGAMGEDDENLENYDLAQQKYEELHRVTSALLKTDPDNPDRIYANAQSQNRIALLAHSQKISRAALLGFGRSKKLPDPILPSQKTKPEWVQLAAYLNGNLCAVIMEEKQYANTALSHCLAAVSYNERLVRLLPQKQAAKYDLVFHYAWLSDAWTANGNEAQSIASSRRSLSLVEALISTDPDNMHWREQEMQIRVRLAEKMTAQNEAIRSAQHLAGAKRISEMLVAHDSRNAVWQRYYKRLHAISK